MKNNLNLRIKPSKEELQIIQDMIYENYSYTAIGKHIGMSDKTVKKIITVYDIDISKYSARVAAGKLRKNKLSEKDKKFILDNINEGISLRQIVKNFSITYPTLKRLLDEEGIDYKSYTRKSKTKFSLTDEELADVQLMIDKKITITEISKKYSVNRNTFSAYLREKKIIKDKVDIDDKIKNFIIKCHKQYITISNIHILTGISKTTIKNIISDVNVEITEKDKYKKNANSKEILMARLNEYNKITNASIIEAQDITYLINNINKKTYFDIVKDLNVNHKELRHYAICLGYKEIFSYENIESYDYFEEFKNDMCETHNSNSYIGFKYGIPYTTISSWRKELFGNVKSYYNSNISRTTLEMKFELILHKLDLAYIREYIVKGLQYDYYLGHKILVELQGEYWHSKETNNDSIKEKVSKENGFYLLQIQEKEIDDPNLCTNILNLYLEQINKQYLNS